MRSLSESGMRASISSRSRSGSFCRFSWYRATITLSTGLKLQDRAKSYRR